jgi:hypothetical protein
MIGFPYHASIEQLGRLVIDPPPIGDNEAELMEGPILKSTLDTIAPKDGPVARRLTNAPSSIISRNQS